MTKIIILGGKGMLGQMVATFFSKRYTVSIINERYTFENRSSFFDAIRQEGRGYVINCIGKIKQKSNDLNDLLWVNASLPLDLRINLTKEQFLIHPSTDCVYDGNLKGGKYKKSHKPNASDEYGWSKYLGEQTLLGFSGSVVVRVSIIGPDKFSKVPKGLLGWFLSNPDRANLKGFTNHYWNGITTLEWCKQIYKLIETNEIATWEGRLLQLGTKEVYNKKVILDIFQSQYKTNFEISEFETKNAVNRCLQPDIYSHPLEEQIKELVMYDLENLLP